MPRFGATPLAFPDFRGSARFLILFHLIGICAIEMLGWVSSSIAHAIGHLLFFPSTFLGGQIWQCITYCLFQSGIASTVLALLSIWFLAGFLDASHRSNWVISLYFVSVVGAALAAAAIYLVSQSFSKAPDSPPLYGCMGGIFGLLMAIGLLHGDTEFQLLFLIGIKARYMAILYALIAIATLFTSQQFYAFAELGGGVAALLYIKLMPSRGAGFVFSESLYGVRNRYYRWKRRRAARKFEVYMRKQGRTVRFDGQGKLIDEDRIHEEGDDKKRWN